MKKLLLLLVLSASTIFANSGANELLQKSNNKNYFIENRGQWTQEVKYLAKIGGMNAWITDFGVVYYYYKITRNYTEEELLQKPEYEQEEYRRKNTSVKGHVVKSIFNNNNFSQHFVGENQQETYYNYFLGNDKSKWVSNVQLFEGATIEELYQGIDIKYYFDEGLLRYDFIIKPGADIAQITIALEGMDSYTINDNGELELETSLGKISHRDIVAYQKNTNGENEIVKTLFTQKENGAIGFVAENYDKQKELIIDPLVYSTFIGGNGNDQGLAIALDNSGNVFVTGITNSTDYPVSSGAYDEIYNGGNADIFVSKLNSTGTALVYSTFIGGNGNDQGLAIALDNSGNVFVSGGTESTDYPVTSGAYDESFNGSADVFVSKLNSTGTALVYSTFLGGSGDDRGDGISLDNSGNVFVTGSTNISDFPVTSGAYDESFNGDYDVFVSKLNSTGTALVYSTFLGGNFNDRGHGITLDNSGNVFVAGFTISTNYPVTSGAYDESFNGDLDVFVTKLNANGSQLEYSTFLGGSGTDWMKGITLDNTGNVIVTGLTLSTNYPVTSGAYDESFNGDYDVFVSKLNSTGTALVYSTFLGGSGYDKGDGIALDNTGNVIVTGVTLSTNYPVTSGAYDESFNGSADVFVSKLNSTGTALVYSTFIGGTSGEGGYAIALDNIGNVIVTGFTGSTDYPVVSGAYDESFNGDSDVFVTKIDINTQLFITSPNGGEMLQAQTQYNITWQSNNIVNVKIEYSTDNGSTWSIIVNSTPAANQSYQWTVPSVVSTQNKIRITDTANPTFNDVSDESFSIYIPFEFISPVGGENWQAGTQKNITWTGDNGGNVTIEYSIDNGTNWLNIVTTNSASGNYTWSIPNISSAEVKIRLSDPDYPANSSVSQVFNIVQLNLTYPTAGANLGITSQIDITWESGLINNIKIEFSTNNGTDWINIVSSTAASPGSYSWIVPNTPSDECKMRITDTSDPLITSETAGTFTIFIEDIYARLLMDSVIVQFPSYVNVLFHALDEDFKGIENLLPYEFEAKEDGVVISPAESRLQVGGIDQIDLDLKTVLLLDNSTSVQPNLQQIKDAAIALINTKLPEQEIALYVFSENPVLIQDFTTDVSTLINAVNSITVGFPTTNLYGSIITALSRWEDSVTLELIKQGFLVLLTDGDDTQGSSTLSQVLQARGDKKIYAIGLGSDLNMSILKQIGNAGAFNIIDINELLALFVEIQQDLIAFTNSFYWLNYVSPKRGDFDHTLRISITTNLNSGSDSYMETTFNSNGFYSIYFGITVNATPQNPLGVDEITIPANANVIVKIETPFTFNIKPYQFIIEDEDLLSIVSLPDITEYNFLGSALQGQSTTVTINDITNGYTKILTVNFSAVTAVEDEETIPLEYSISQNYPNPFNPSTIINYGLPEQAQVTLNIYNILGEKVATLVNEVQQPGYYKIEFNASYLTSGIYFYRLQAGSFIETKKMLLLK